MVTDKIKVAVRVRPFSKRGKHLPISQKNGVIMVVEFHGEIMWIFLHLNK